MKTVACYIIAAVGLLLSCDYLSPQQSNEKVLANVDGKELWLSGIEQIFPDSISRKDSIELLKNYVNNWARKCLMAAKAEKELNDSQKNITQEVDNYKMMLLAYRYETQYIASNLDTLVTERELLDYYQQLSASLPPSAGVPSVEQLRQQYYTTIINKRRQDLINKLENDTYNEALDSQRLKIYIHE